MSVPVHIPVLLYHRVNKTPSATTTSPEVFRSHLEWLAENGWRSLRLDEFEAAVGGRTAPGNRRFLLTYDDGSADLAKCADEMARFDFTGVAFLITGRQRVADPASLATSEVVKLASSGTFEFQSHTERHVRITPDRSGLDALAEDLQSSRGWLVKTLNVPEKSVRHLAWPWGQCTPEMESLANELGYGWQYLVQRGVVTHGSRQVRLPRMCADGMSLTQFSRWMTVMGSRPGGQLVNHLFGPIRRVRHGLAYW